jgi:hypothetical protein
VDGAKFSVTQPVYTKSLGSRQIWTRHGVPFSLHFLTILSFSFDSENLF